MTQGLYVRTDEKGWHRPASKKAVKEAAAAGPSYVRVEATSMFGNEPDGILSVLIDEAPLSVTFVGPDPYTKRNFYGTLTVSRDGRVVVK